MRSSVEIGVIERKTPSDAWAGLRPSGWASLPMNVRLQHRLGEVLLLIDSVRSEFQTEEATPFLWLDELMDKLFQEVDAAMRGLTD